MRLFRSDIIENLWMALGTLRANKLRSFLTVIGVIIGVVTETALRQSLYDRLDAQLDAAAKRSTGPPRLPGDGGHGYGPPSLLAPGQVTHQLAAHIRNGLVDDAGGQRADAGAALSPSPVRLQANDKSAAVGRPALTGGSPWRPRPGPAA